MKYARMYPDKKSYSQAIKREKDIIKEVLTEIHRIRDVAVSSDTEFSMQLHDIANNLWNTVHKSISD